MAIVQKLKQTSRTILEKSGWNLSRIQSGPKLDLLSVQLTEANAKQVSLHQDDQFIDDNGTAIPLDFNYRYSVKPCWKAFPVLINLTYLSNHGKLSAEEEAQLVAYKGSSTITASLEEINEFALPLLKRNIELFEEGSYVNSGYGVPRHTDEYYQTQIDKMQNYVSAGLELVKQTTGKSPSKVLDVGCGRGISTASFSNLGLQALGLDSNYGDESESLINANERKRVQKLANGDYTFTFNDIRDCPFLEDESFDLIYSISCLEHIKNIEKAFQEMYRLLEPGGVILHHLNPFWSENGGHALGILDAPWLHTMLSEDEFKRYLQEKRPFETELAVPWTDTGLNREITINSLQRMIVDAGFQLCSWTETMGNPDRVKHIDRSVLSLAQQKYSDVTIADLLATDITFVAQKPFN